jgi:Nif-specific regulatory protein
VNAERITTDQVLAAGQKLLELRPVGEVLESVLSAAGNSIHAETALILLRDEKGKLNVAAQKHRSEPRGLEQISSSMLEEAFARREPVLAENAISDPRFSGRSSIILQRIHAAVILPLVARERIIGAIYLDSRSDRSQFHRDNLPALSTLAAFSTLAIENARRYDEAKHSGGDWNKLTSLIGASPAMQELFSMIERVSASDLPVIVAGESGTGKELVAREIHLQSARKDKPFLALYCGNVAPQLFESELFGYKKGSFTGATADKPGLVQAAAGGTLFLDEVADIPTDMQTKLLRFLQEGEYRAVGDTKVQKADVRIIAATNKDLQREVGADRFRSDLYYRLYILPIQTPPLRERLSDVAFLVRHFIEKYSAGRNIGVSPDALRRLMNYSWPGNVRELENTIARALVVARGDRIEPDDVIMTEIGAVDQPEDATWKGAERKHILHVLSMCGGNKSRAADMLGISRRYLHYKLKEWEEHQ